MTSSKQDHEAGSPATPPAQSLHTDDRMESEGVDSVDASVAPMPAPGPDGTGASAVDADVGPNASADRPVTRPVGE